MFSRGVLRTSEDMSMKIAFKRRRIAIKAWQKVKRLSSPRPTAPVKKKVVHYLAESEPVVCSAVGNGNVHREIF